MAWVYWRKNYLIFLMDFFVGMNPETKRKEMNWHDKRMNE